MKALRARRSSMLTENRSQDGRVQEGEILATVLPVVEDELEPPTWQGRIKYLN